MSAVLVFGSNLNGWHGGGAARHAVDQWGAVMSQPIGIQGNAYAIPTMDRDMQTMPIDEIRPFVREFLVHARANPMRSFLVTAIGCGIAGHSASDIAPLFEGGPENVFISEKLIAALR